MLREIRDNLKYSFSLLKRSAGPIVAFELIYKLAASFIVLPLAVSLITWIAKLSGFKLISNENFTKAIFSPPLIITVLVLIIVLGAFTMIEISFLTLSYTQTENDKPIDFLRMLKIAGSDSLRMLKPQNLILVPFFILLIPAANSAVISTLVSGFPMGDFIIDRGSSNSKYAACAVVLAIIASIIILMFAFVFQEYCLYDSDAKGAFIGSKKLMKDNHIKMIVVCGSNILIYAFIVIAIKEIVYILISVITYLCLKHTYLYSAVLALNSTVKNVFDFAEASFIVVCAYAVLSAYYFKTKREKNLVAPKAVQPRFNDSAARNRRVAIISCAFCLFNVMGYSFITAKSDIAGFNSGTTLVMAHRGASKEAPENTIPAFEKAIEQKADYIELDVQETKDGAVVVTHDENTKRVTGHKGYVYNMTLAEIKELDAAHYFKGYSNVKIPTLEEVFQTCGGRIKFNIELKYNKHTENLAQSVADLIEKYGLQDDCVITSTKKAALRAMKEAMPDIPCGYILSASIGKYYDLDCADFFSIDINSVTKSSLSKCHKVGKSVNAWTVNDTDSIQKMIALGVDGIITDDPLKAREAIAASEAPFSILSYLLELVYN